MPPNNFAESSTHLNIASASLTSITVPTTVLPLLARAASVAATSRSIARAESDVDAFCNERIDYGSTDSFGATGDQCSSSLYLQIHDLFLSIKREMVCQREDVFSQTSH
jgi:hypothetical protein